MATTRGRWTVGGGTYSPESFLWRTGGRRRAGGWCPRQPGVLRVLRVQPSRGRFFNRRRGAGQDGRRRAEPRPLAGAVRRPRRRHRHAHASRRPRLRGRRHSATRLRLPRRRTRACGRRRSGSPPADKPQVRVFPAIARLRTGASSSRPPRRHRRGPRRLAVDGRGPALRQGWQGRGEDRSDLDDAVSHREAGAGGARVGVMLVLLVALRQRRQPAALERRRAASRAGRARGARRQPRALLRLSWSSRGLCRGRPRRRAGSSRSSRRSAAADRAGRFPAPRERSPSPAA